MFPQSKAPQSPCPVVDRLITQSGWLFKKISADVHMLLTSSHRCQQHRHSDLTAPGHLTSKKTTKGATKMSSVNDIPLTRRITAPQFGLEIFDPSRNWKLAQMYKGAPCKEWGHRIITAPVIWPQLEPQSVTPVHSGRIAGFFSWGSKALNEDTYQCFLP